MSQPAPERVSVHERLHMHSRNHRADGDETMQEGYLISICCQIIQAIIIQSVCSKDVREERTVAVNWCRRR